MGLIVNPTKRKGTSILMDDLMGNTSFGIKQTLPILDMQSDVYDSGMDMYLTQLGVKEIERTYNEQIRMFESELEEQEVAAQLQAELAADAAANRAVEFQPGLGTGAAAAASEGRQAALGDTQTAIAQSIEETYAEGMTEFSENYLTELESRLGKYDPTTNTFAGLSEYQATANLVNQAAAKALAKFLDPNADTDSSTSENSYLQVLKQAGFATSDNAGGIILTESGEKALQRWVNGLDLDTANPALGDMTFNTFVAEQMAKDAVGGAEMFAKLSEAKRTELLLQYKSWLNNNFDSMRVSHWDLGYYDGEKLVVDRGQFDQGTDIGMMELSTMGWEELSASIKDNTEFTKWKGDIVAGKYNGQYVSVPGETADDTKIYYAENGKLYDSGYTLGDPPKTIRLDQANHLLFGTYAGTGEGGKQDKWTNAIIDAAKAGRLPNYTVVQFNYGDVKENGLYRYVDGEFRYIENQENMTSSLLVGLSKEGAENVKKYTDW